MLERLLSTLSHVYFWAAVPLYLKKTRDTPPRGGSSQSQGRIWWAHRGCQSHGSPAASCVRRLSALSAESLRYGQPSSTPQLSSREFAAVPVHLPRFPVYSDMDIWSDLTQLDPPWPQSSDCFFFVCLFLWRWSSCWTGKCQSQLFCLSPRPRIGSPSARPPLGWRRNLFSS